MGLGPMTSAVTGRRSNQLSHQAIIVISESNAIASTRQSSRNATLTCS